MFQNLHTNSTYCDGSKTCEEMILGAIEKGIKSLGFSGHAPMKYPNTYCMTEENVLDYIKEVRTLKEKYKGEIEIFLGIENECLSPYPIDEFDYIISAVHVMEKKGLGIEVDYTQESLVQSISHFYGGDALLQVREYYDLLVKASKKGDILAHCDLITKFNQKTPLFDELSSPYVDIARDALVAAIENGIIIEINTGGVQRGYRKTFYPHPQFLKLMLEKNAKIIISSDAHSIDALGFFYDESVEILKSYGFKSQMRLTENGFIDVEL